MNRQRATMPIVDAGADALSISLFLPLVLCLPGGRLMFESMLKDTSQSTTELHSSDWGFGMMTPHTENTF